MGLSTPSPLPAAQQLSAGLSHRRRCLQALSRLGERDTQDVGTEELTGIIASTVDGAEASTLLSLLCNTGIDQRPHARKESVRLLGVLASGSCPARDLVLQSGNLSKALAYLRTRFKDNDASVRSACADTVGILAENLSQSRGMQWGGDTVSNPVLKLIFELLSDQKREVVPYLPSLASSLWRTLLRLLNSSSFQARPDLISATVCCSADHTSCAGLLTLPLESTAPYLGPLMGQAIATGPTGLLGCTLSPDWAVRKAAADGIRAAAVSLGPVLPSLDLSMIATALNPLKFDKMKPVRSAAVGALAVLSDLQAFQPGSEDVQAAWRQVCIESRIAASSPVGTPLASPARSLAASQIGRKSRSSSLGDNSVLERFKSAGGHQDLVVASPLAAWPTKAASLQDKVQAQGPINTEERSDNLPHSRMCGVQRGSIDGSSSEKGHEPLDADPPSTAPLLSQGRNVASSANHAPAAGAKTGGTHSPGLEHSVGDTAEQLKHATSQALAACGHKDAASNGQSAAHVPAVSTSLAGMHCRLSIADSADEPEPTVRTYLDESFAGKVEVGNGPTSRRASESFVIVVEPAKAPKRPSLTSGAINPSKAAGALTEVGDADSACHLPRGSGLRGSNGKSRSPSKSTSGEARSSVMHSPKKAAYGMSAKATRLLGGAGPAAAGSADLARILEQQSAVIRVVTEYASKTDEALAAIRARLDRLEHAHGLTEAADGLEMNSHMPSLKISPSSFPGFNTPTLQQCDSPTDFRKPSTAQGDKRHSYSGSPDRKPGRYVVPSMARPASAALQQVPGATTPSILSPVTSMDTSWTNCDSTDGDATPDLESRYAEALQNACGASASGELELLRLMQRTGSAWADLSSETADGLLGTMIKLLHERTAIPRILPWLKELAHPSCTVTVLQSNRAALLAALASVPASEDVANAGGVSKLFASLQSSWGTVEVPRMDTKPAPVQTPAVFARKSIDDMKAELEEIQSRFQKA